MRNTAANALREVRSNNGRGAYVHVPFCRHRCGYCNFSLVAGRDDLIDRYLEAIKIEASWLPVPRPVDSIFIGGGTPSHLPLAKLESFLANVRNWFPLVRDGEFSVEVNPADVTFEKVNALADYGVNRLSLGVQSFDKDKLKTLERDHDSEMVRQSVEIARSRLNNISFDLIFGVPGEDRRIWQKDIELAIDLCPEHLSCYGLTIERGTAFFSLAHRGKLNRTSEVDERWMYEYAIDTLEANRFEHYEVSNFALDDKRCRHNENYWRGGEYFALGPGAASHLDGERKTNHRSVTTYLRRILNGESPDCEQESLDAPGVFRERLVFGLRMMEGVDLEMLRQETGTSLDQESAASIEQFVQQGLLERTADRLKLTRKGLLVSDSILSVLV